MARVYIAAAHNFSARWTGNAEEEKASEKIAAGNHRKRLLYSRAHILLSSPRPGQREKRGERSALWEREWGAPRMRQKCAGSSRGARRRRARRSAKERQRKLGARLGRARPNHGHYIAPRDTALNVPLWSLRALFIAHYDWVFATPLPQPGNLSKPAKPPAIKLWKAGWVYLGLFIARLFIKLACAELPRRGF